LQWLRAALAAEAPVEPLVRRRAEVGLAQLAFIAGDYVASFASIESALPVGRVLGDNVVLARCLATAGYVWWFPDPERSTALSRTARLITACRHRLRVAFHEKQGWRKPCRCSEIGRDY